MENARSLLTHTALYKQHPEAFAHEECSKSRLGHVVNSNKPKSILHLLKNRGWSHSRGAVGNTSVFASVIHFLIA